MITNKYEQAVNETRSVLDEWDVSTPTSRITHEYTTPFIARAVVARLIAKGVIQSTDPDDLVEPQYRTGPLAPGRVIVGGDDLPVPGSVQRES
jgi:hypothetical protein